MYHKGEQEAQIKSGEKEIGERNGRVITNKIIPGAFNFIEKQLFIIVSSMNQDAEICVSVITGEEGFVKVINQSTICIDRRLINSNPRDLFCQNIMSHLKVGMLFIEPVSRRRFRVNGRISLEEDVILVLIDQAYPNCPKYIQQRHILRKEHPGYTDNARWGTSLTPAIKEMIQKADTFFVGSSDETGNLDASHRGGSPGFITIDIDGSLLIPDYKGNSMYNTLGNLLVNPKAGLVFLDFENHSTLQLMGMAKVVWKQEDEKGSTGGTGRFWKFYPNKWVFLENLKGYDWDFVAYSPFNPT